MATVEEVQAKVMADFALGANNNPFTQKNDKKAQATEEEPKEREYTDFEQEQMKKGWRPDGRKTAEEWAQAEPLADELRQLKQESKRLHETLAALKASNDKIEQAAYERALAELAQERASAIKRGDLDAVDAVEAKANQLGNPPIAPPPAQDEPPQAFKDFVKRNEQWMNGKTVTEIEMVAFAQERDKIIAMKNLESPEEHVQLLEDCIKQKFPEYFGINAEVGEKKETHYAKSTAPVAKPTGVTTKGTKKFTRSDLNPIQESVLKNFLHFKVMTEEQYIDSLVKTGDLK